VETSGCTTKEVRRVVLRVLGAESRVGNTQQRTSFALFPTIPLSFSLSHPNTLALPFPRSLTHALTAAGVLDLGVWGEAGVEISGCTAREVRVGLGAWCLQC
jgi:hypothetical protein